MVTLFSYSIHDWVQFPTFDTPAGPKTPLALAPGPFFRGLARWATPFLIGFEHFFILFDRNLIPSDAAGAVLTARRYIL